jgi:peroxiredoxin
LNRAHLDSSGRLPEASWRPPRPAGGRAQAAAFLATCLLMAACGGSRTEPEQPFGVSRGQPPEQSGVRLFLEQPDGETIELERFRGRRVLLFFFTTYDIASQLEMEHLIGFAPKHPELKVVGVALQPNAAKLLGLYRDYLEIPFPVAYDPTGRVKAGLSDLGQIPSVPSFVLLDETGRVVGRHAGATTAEVLGPLIRGSGGPEVDD